MFFANLVVVMGYVYICLYYKQDTQLKVAKFLTFIYSIVMTITIVGLMIQVQNLLRTLNRITWLFVDFIVSYSSWSNIV